MMDGYATFKRQGLSLRVYDTGGSGLPFVFQHGLCGDSSQTREVFPAHGNVRLITVECRGHGQSDAGDADGISIASFADDILAYIQEQDLQRYVVGGISMGAAIALRLAHVHPQGVAGLVQARPAWLAAPAPANMRPNAVVGTLMAEFGGTRGMALFRESVTAQRLTETAPDNLASLYGFFSRQPETVTAELLRRIAADGPGVSESGISGLAVPTLVIGHKRDAVHPLALAQRLAALMPNAELREITPKADSKPRYIADFAGVLRNFLEVLK